MNTTSQNPTIFLHSLVIQQLTYLCQSGTKLASGSENAAEGLAAR